MSCETFCQGDSVIHRLDPRVRVVAALAFSVLVAVGSRFPVILAALALVIAAAVIARLPLAPTLKRLATLNVFMALVVVVLPFSMPGRNLFSIGQFAFTMEGLLRAAAIALKANTILLALTVLVSTIELPRLGHALSHLHVPQKLTLLFLFTVRYIDVLHHEYRRLADAMKVRCFRAHLNLHTLRSLGYLVGMLLVNSLDRSERVAGAMKCRGFRGKFWILHHFSMARRDVVFAAGTLAVLLLLAFGEWSCPNL